MKDKNYNSVGVIVGKFQLAQLHETQVELIQRVYNKHDKVLLFLGLSPKKGTINSPLDFQPRKQMLLEYFPMAEYPNLDIAYIKDCADDNVWSENLDQMILKKTEKYDTILIYGGENTVLEPYNGGFGVEVLEPNAYISVEGMRKSIAENPKSSADFRAGAIWATHQRYPTVFTTVDIVVYNDKLKRVLLARKKDENKYRFIGGFADPADKSFEMAALRELDEETGLTVGMRGLHYIGSAIIDDWRYRDEVDKIKTLLYMGAYSYGAPQARDDIEEVRWVTLKEFPDYPMVLEHIVLRDMFMDFLPTFVKNLSEGDVLRTAAIKIAQ